MCAALFRRDSAVAITVAVAPLCFSQSLQLMNRIASLRSYFFCAYGDYLTHFIDIASNELRKPVPAPDAGSASPSSGPPTPAATPATPGGSLLAQAEYVSLDRLQSLLELSVRTAITADDPFKVRSLALSPTPPPLLQRRQHRMM